MKTVTSKDGTTVAYDQFGQGPAVIFVDGALQYRAFDQGMAELAELLAPHLTVFHYDRRGRGDSTDRQAGAFEPESALEREIQDLEALIEAAGGSASLYGISSGGALALEAALQLGNKVEKLAIYEVPYRDDAEGQQAWREYVKQLRELRAAGRKADAVGLFMMLVGASAADVEQMHQHPMWHLWEAVGLSLAYDAAALGEDAAVPIARAARVTVPTLVMNGGGSEWSFIQTTAVALASAIPHARHRTLEGQTHEVAAEAIAPVLLEFLTSNAAIR